MKLRKELWFGFSLMAAIIIPVIVLMPWSHLTNGHLGLMMLALICVGIMLGFPTAFTLMGMGVFFAWLAYRSVDPATADRRVLDLFVQRTYGVMSNDVLIAIPLFLFMGYLVERAQLIDKLFKSLHLASARVPGALAVATIVTCAIFATATGIVGAVVTLMGLLAFPAMLKAGYNVKVAAGAVTAGGCLGILIPPSVLLIVYGAVAGVSVVQLYAGAFLPGFMLAGLYIGYIIVLAKWKPKLMPPLAESERRVDLPPFAQALSQQSSNALTGLWRAFTGGGSAGVAKRTVLAQLFVTLVPALFVAAVLGVTYPSRRPNRNEKRRQASSVCRNRKNPGSRNLQPSRRRHPPLLKQARRLRKPRRPQNPNGYRYLSGSGSRSQSVSPSSCSSTGCGTGSGWKCSRCCSPRSSRWR